MIEIVQKKPDGEIFTTSLLIAEKFGRRHKDVLKKIELLPKDDFNGRNFAPVEYSDKKGEARKMYELSRDGFSYIAMGFTGEKAHQWKINFISAFNRMERHLKNIMKHDWLEERAKLGLEYKTMSRTLSEVRKLHGKSTAAHHYINEAKLVNWAMTDQFSKLDRDSLSVDELKILSELEIYNAVLLGCGLDREKRKDKLKARHDELSTLRLTA